MVRGGANDTFGQQSLFIPKCAICVYLGVYSMQTLREHSAVGTHDIENLYVVDGSFFPSAGAVNPALTIAANALRVGEILKRQLGAKNDAVLLEAK